MKATGTQVQDIPIFKMRSSGPEQSHKVVDILQSYGYDWAGIPKEEDYEKPFLYLSKPSMMEIMMGRPRIPTIYNASANSEEAFQEDEEPEISFEGFVEKFEKTPIHKFKKGEGPLPFFKMAVKDPEEFNTVKNIVKDAGYNWRYGDTDKDNPDGPRTLLLCTFGSNPYVFLQWAKYREDLSDIFPQVTEISYKDFIEKYGEVKVA